MFTSACKIQCPSVQNLVPRKTSEYLGFTKKIKGNILETQFNHLAHYLLMKFICLFYKIVVFCMPLQVFILNHINGFCFLSLLFVYATQFKRQLSTVCAQLCFGQRARLSLHKILSPQPPFSGENTCPGLLTADGPHDRLPWRWDIEGHVAVVCLPSPP